MVTGRVPRHAVDSEREPIAVTPSMIWYAIRGLTGPRFRSRSELEEFQSACLRRLVSHAYKRVPYYRRLFDEAGVSPQQIHGVDDLQKIPPTERADIQMLPAREVCARGSASRITRVHRTSGSSGAPLVVRRTGMEECLLLAYRAQAVGSWGFGPRARRANIDHFSRDALTTEAGEMWYEKLGVMPRLNLDWRSPTEEILSRIDQFKPDLISGPPSLLARLADDLDESDRARLHAARVITGAELLSASMRTRIEQGFGCPIADVYGCTETVFIAMEVPGEPGHRLCEEAVIVEVLNNGLPASKGEIFLTSLHQWSMPFIRYRLGDQVELAPGAGPHRVLQSIDGRVTDRFVLADGRQLHGYTLGEQVEGSGLPVRRFQIIQRERDAFRVKLVLDSPNAKELAALNRSLCDTLGQGIEVQIEVVDSLDQPHGKFYPFISYERLCAK